MIAKFDGSSAPFGEQEVKQALDAARSALTGPTNAESLGAWAELLAFALVPNQGQPSPWTTYFGPFGSRTRDDGRTLYAPDIADTPAEVIPHWT